MSLIWEETGSMEGGGGHRLWDGREGGGGLAYIYHLTVYKPVEPGACSHNLNELSQKTNVGRAVDYLWKGSGQ